MLCELPGCTDGKDVSPKDDSNTTSEDSGEEPCNTPPRVVSVSISPDPAFTNDTSTATVEATDAEGDAVNLRYAWLVGGVEVGAGETLDGTTGFDKHDRVHVVVTPSDGTVEGEPASSETLTISNSPPTAPEVRLEPGDPREELDDLLCGVTVEASDADDDTPITYTIAWDVDGVASPEASTTTEPGDTVGVAHTTEGEIWTCAVSTSDGEEAGGVGVWSVTIGACPPRLERHLRGALLCGDPGERARGHGCLLDRSRRRPSDR